MTPNVHCKAKAHGKTKGHGKGQVPTATNGTTGSSTEYRSSTRRSIDNQTAVRLQRFVQRHGVDVAKTIQRQTSNIRAMLKADQSKTKWVLHPEKNALLGRWDMLTSIALIYTASLTPFETSFLPPVVGMAAWRDPWFLINRCLDVIFGLDMVLQFFVAYQTGNAFGARTWIYDHNRIIRHYLSSWFLLDASTVFVPGGLDLWTATSDTFNDQNVSGNSAESKLGILRVLRVLRLVKLARLLRASRLYDRWRARITLSSASITWLSCVFTLLIMGHWFACLIALQATLHSHPEDTWIGERAYALCDAMAAVGRPADAPVLIPGCENLSLPSWYLASLCWALMVITGTGGTDFYPSGDSDGETLVVVVLVVIGAFVWTLILAAFCDVATNSNAALIRFRQQLDGLNLLISMHSLPKNLAHRMRAYMHQQKGVLLREDAKQALPLLSPALQIEVVLYMHRHWLEGVWFVRDLDAPVKVRLAMAMRPKVLAPKELAPNRHLYVIARGQVMFGNRMYSHGMAWGDDVILSNQKLFLPFLARAMTYADVACVTRAQLYELAAPYPETMRTLRRSTIMLALRRALIIMLRERNYSRAASSCKQGNVLAMEMNASSGQNMYGSFLKKVNEIPLSESQEESQDIALRLCGTDTLTEVQPTPTRNSLPPAAAPRVRVLEQGSSDERESYLSNTLEELRSSMRTLTDTVQRMQQDMQELRTQAPLPPSVRGTRLPSRVGPLSKT